MLHLADEDEAFHIPAYQQSHLLDDEVSKSRVLQKFFDRYPFMTPWERSRKAGATPSGMPPHGGLRNVLEKVTRAGSVNEVDVAELEYQEYITTLKNPIREAWASRK